MNRKQLRLALLDAQGQIQKLNQDFALLSRAVHQLQADLGTVTTESTNDRLASMQRGVDYVSKRLDEQHGRYIEVLGRLTPISPLVFREFEHGLGTYDVFVSVLRLENNPTTGSTRWRPETWTSIYHLSVDRVRVSFPRSGDFLVLVQDGQATWRKELTV